MRFLSDGPSIPDELLVARDEGRVVFFCGAGVSRARARLADFFELAQAVVDKLGAEPESPARKLIRAAQGFSPISGVGSLISADRVFSLLEREFLASDISRAIANSLAPSDDLDLSAHRILLDLARGPDGRVHLVTTNFDLLFETCDSTLTRWRPPQLPDPNRSDEFSGIIHLHGHVDDGYKDAAGDGFVISSAEFGRAYLSDGWATQFIRTVLQRYFVVFIGYAADDPPVQYLLEALNRTSGSRDGVYAFQSGSIADAESRWLHKGVHSIAYEDSTNHNALWETLAAWATRARSPDDWYSGVIANARHGPEALEPHERGQVAHIVSTIEGARKFSAANDPPPASWLCVFDPAVRFAKPAHLGSLNERGPFFDPFDSYGLDSDPVPPKIRPDDHSTNRDVPTNVWNCFALSRHDRENLREESLPALRGHWAVNSPRLVTRLSNIGEWLSNVSGQPAAVWWAANQIGIHPDLQQRIRHKIERESVDCSQTIRRAWRYIFESWEVQGGEFRRDWFQLLASVKLDGWSAPAIREFALIHRPYLKAGRPYFGGPRPPDIEPSPSLNDLITLDVEYPNHSENILIPIPDDYLSYLVKELRKNLESAVCLENEIGGYGLQNVCPIEADTDVEGESFRRDRGISKCILRYVGFFRRLTEVNPKLAKLEVLAWRSNDDPVFDRLRIWTCGDHRIMSGEEVASTLLSLDQDAFWDSYHQRDLLLVLSRRWNDLPITPREDLERRLLNGRSRFEGEEHSDFVERRAWSSLTRIYWLHGQGCQFSFDIEVQTAGLKKGTPDWKAEHATTAAASIEGRTSTVFTDTDSRSLLSAPLETLLDTAQALSGRGQSLFVERDPYVGLCNTKPMRAFAALAFAGKRGRSPSWAWRTFLNSEPSRTARLRLAVAVAERLSRLPNDQVAELAYPISEWLLATSEKLLAQRPDKFSQLWSKLIDTLKTKLPGSESAIQRVGNKTEWATEALNAPVGKLAQATMNDPQKNGLKRGAGFPAPWIGRVEELLSLPGDLGRHALVMFSFNLHWFFWIDPKWTEKNIVSRLADNDDDSNAIWAGFFWAAKVPRKTLYFRMKPALLSLANKKSLARREHAQILAGILLAGWNTIEESSGQRFITDAEMRTVLINADDDFRSQVLWELERLSRESNSPWATEGLLFLERVWPRQKIAKSPAISARLCQLAFSHEDRFSDYVDCILPLVTSIEQDYPSIPSLTRSKDNIVDKFPDKTLALLKAVLPDDARKWPYGIDETLNRIGAANSALLSDERLIDLRRKWAAR